MSRLIDAKEGDLIRFPGGEWRRVTDPPVHTQGDEIAEIGLGSVNYREAKPIQMLYVHINTSITIIPARNVPQ